MLAKISPTQSKTTLAIQSFAETAMSPQDVETVRRASVLLNIPLSLKQRIFVNVKGDAKTTTMIFESRFKLQPTTEKTLREMGLEKIYKGNSKEYTWQATFTQKLYEALEELATKINKQGEESVETPYFDEVGTATFAPAQTQEVAYDVQNIPLESIFIDKARFQPRDDFSEEKVNEIVNNFNPALFKPLIVWKDPKDGKIYVLAGHHRYEALKRLKRKSAPVVFAQGDEQKAVELAWTENQSGRSQTAAENAKYLRKLAMSGRTKGEIQTECKRLYDRSCQVALDLAYLNPRGKALVDLGLMPRESETFRDMETMAQWIGKLRGRFEELTNSHENEVYDFLRENYKIRGKKFTNFAEFSAFMENIITKRTTFGKVDEVLNINTYTPQNTVQAEYDAEIARAERELAEAMEMLKKEREKALLREMKGEITATQRENGLRKYEDAVTIAQRELLRLNEAKGKGVREAKESEMALFGLRDKDTKNVLLQKWNSSSLTDTQREQVRRAAVLLGITLSKSFANSLPKEVPSIFRQDNFTWEEYGGVGEYFKYFLFFTESEAKQALLEEAPKVRKKYNLPSSFEPLRIQETSNGRYNLWVYKPKEKRRLINNDLYYITTKPDESIYLVPDCEYTSIYKSFSKRGREYEVYYFNHPSLWNKEFFAEPTIDGFVFYPYQWYLENNKDYHSVKKWIAKYNAFKQKQYRERTNSKASNVIFNKFLRDELSDTADLLLAKWNDSSLTATQREQVRRAVVVINLQLVDNFPIYIEKVIAAFTDSRIKLEPAEISEIIQIVEKYFEFIENDERIRNTIEYQSKGNNSGTVFQILKGELTKVFNRHRKSNNNLKISIALYNSAVENYILQQAFLRASTKAPISNDGTWDSDDDNILSDDTSSVHEKILSKWNDSTLTNEEREKVRREIVSNNLQSKVIEFYSNIYVEKDSIYRSAKERLENWMKDPFIKIQRVAEAEKEYQLLRNDRLLALARLNTQERIFFGNSLNTPDLTDTRETLLAKWNDTTIPSESREVLRRAATLLGITLPNVNVSAESSPKTEWWSSATNNVETPLGMGKIVYWKVRIGGMVTGGGTALRWGLLVNDLIFPHAELQPIKSNLIPFEILSDESLRGWIAFSHKKKKPSGQRDTAMFVTKLYRESAQRIQEYIEYQKIEAEKANTPPILAQNLQRGDILAEWHEPTKEYVFVERILSDAYDPPQFVTYLHSTEKSRFNRYDTKQIHAEVLYGFRYVQNPISTPEQIQAALLYVDKEELDEWEEEDTENTPLPEKPQESSKTTSGYPPRPEAVTESAELIPQPEIFFPKGKYAISDDAYMACNLALTRYKNGGRGFLLADGTGFGKTRQILVIAHEYQQMTGGHVLIVTENESIIQGNFKKDQEALRIVNPKVEITTYTKVADGLYNNRNFALVAFDEAHNLKNSDSLKTIASGKLKTDYTLFATATPMDTVVGAAYFISAVTNIPKNQVFAMLGFRVETKTIDGQAVQKIVLDKNSSYEVIKNNIVKVRQDMIESGAMVRRVFPFYGNVRSIMIPLTDEQRQEDDQIWDSFEDEIEMAKENGQGMKAMNLAGQRSGELSRLNEPRKIQAAYDLVKEELAKGNQVVVIAEGINTTTISAINKTVRGTIETLVERLKAEGIGVSEGYGANKSAKVAAIADFQSGKNKVIIGTPQSISTGIDLDDQTGNAPRALIMVTASYSGNTFQQILGRVSRRNTLSPAEVIILYTESVSDRRRKEIVDKKLEVLRLIQSGKAVMDAEETEGLEQSVNKIQGGTKEESSTHITRGVAVTESGDKAAVSIKPHGNGILVYGNTFPLRETLKNLGGRWNGTLKGWIFPPSKMDELNAALKISEQKPESAVLAPVQYASKADIFLKRSGRKLLLTGNTKRVENIIREFFGAWNIKRKAWEFGDWQQNALETKLGIKAWQDSSEQMALRDAEEEFLQEWFEEEGVSLEENGENTFNNRNMLVLSTAPTIPDSLQQGLKHAIERFNDHCAVPLSVANITLDHDEDYFDAHWRLIGEYRLSEQTIVLNTGREPEDLLIAMFWHEYAHHLYFVLSLQEKSSIALFFEEVRKTNGFSTAEEYDRQEGDTYWTSEEELWARVVGQYFVLISEEKTQYRSMVEALEEAGMQQWSYAEITKLKPLLEYVLIDSGFTLIHAHDL